MRNLLAGAVVVLTLAGCAAQTPSTLTDEELSDYLVEMQDQAWFYAGASNETRPRVEPTLMPADDLEQAFTDCYQNDALTEAQCDMALIAYPEDIGYFSSSELNYVYDYYADELVPCLATEGLSVGYAPTRAEFVQAGWMSWEPYRELGAKLPPSRAEAVVEKCPQYPPLPFSSWDD